MPIYEYECQSCGKVFEVFQKISDEPLKECRFCKGVVNRLISMCSFQLKGTGWYVTDYKSPASAAKGNGGKHGEEQTKTEKPETKTEAKAEKKAEAKTETAKSATTGGAA
ncbi:MAG: FmdB family zinc ribbon protein [Syntrophorhabdales bacterium]|jgi:putative FmdB family regulatory protein